MSHARGLSSVYAMNGARPKIKMPLLSAVNTAVRRRSAPGSLIQEPRTSRTVLVRRRIGQVVAGGSWTQQLGASTRQNLRWFWFDGLFAQASESIIVTYLTLFVLALGATRGQIGLMSALVSLSGALVLLPGAALVERYGRRKLMVLLGGGGGGRAALLLLAVLPIFVSGPAAVSFAIGLAVLRSAFGNLSLPAWTALTAEIVPLSWRGRYFSSRNIAMGISGMAAAFLIGQLIMRVGNLTGYQLALGGAFGVGLLSTFSFSRIRETTQVAAPSYHSTRLPVWHRLRAHPGFLTFCAVAALWNLSMGIAAPFFSVYLVQSLHASAGIIGLLSVVNTLTALPGQRLFGVLADRWGPRRVQLLTGLLIPIVPVGWALTRSPWHVVPVELMAGFVWAGYGLASFNFLLELTPEDRRSRFTALYQIAVTVALAAGNALGGVFVTQWGYRLIFVMSGVGRLISALLFAYLVRNTTADR
jgi:MFS family permease